MCKCMFCSGNAIQDVTIIKRMVIPPDKNDNE